MRALTQPRRGRWLLRILFLLLLLLFLLLGAVWMYIPVLIRAKAREALREALGDEAEVEGVAVSMGDASLSFEGFVVPAQEIDEQLLAVSFEALRVQFRSLWDALRGEPEVIGVEVVGPQVTAQAGAHVPLNLADVMTRRGEMIDPITAAIPLETARISGGQIELRGALAEGPPTITLQDLNLDVQGLPQAVEEGTGEVTLSGDASLLGAPATLAVTGRWTDPTHADFDLTLHIDGLELARLIDPAAPQPAVTLTGGLADADMQGTVTGGRLDATVTCQLRDVQVTTNLAGFQDRAFDVPAQTAAAFFQSPAAAQPFTAAVRGDMTDPQFDLVSEIAKAIRAALRQRIQAATGTAR